MLMLTRLAKEGELTASGVAYAVIIMPVFELVVLLLSKNLENNHESALLVLFLTAAGQASLSFCQFVCLPFFPFVLAVSLSVFLPIFHILIPLTFNTVKFQICFVRMHCGAVVAHCCAIFLW